MLSKVYNWNNEEVGEIELDDTVFAMMPRIDIMHTVVNWQLAKRRAGTHKAKTISEVSGTTKKPFKQKGTGNARQGSLRSVQMRGGGISHGPRVRSHAFDLPKKVRRLGLCSALSAKCHNDSLIVVDSFECDKVSTKEVKDKIGRFGFKSYFLVDLDKNDNLLLSVRNVHGIDFVPQIGVNVYDVLRHDCVMISVGAVEALVERLV